MLTIEETSILSKINVDRIMGQLDQLAKIGQIPAGGITRLAFSREDKVARELLIQFMRNADLEVSKDRVGNIIGRIPGDRPNTPVILTGSHIDTVVNAGKLDGVLGVLASLECARVIHQNVKPRSSIEVICFVMEEASRFGGINALGSRAMIGHSISDRQLQSQDALGITLAAAVQELKSWETGQSIDWSNEGDIFMRTKKDILAARRDLSQVGAFVELHIEQGPVLGTTRKKIGIVTGVAGFTRFKIGFLGEQNHSGATPMALRRDALVAAAEAILCVEQITNREAGKGLVGTVGVMKVYPGAVNTIPGRAEIYIDIRGMDMEVRKKTAETILGEIEAIGRRRSIKIEVEKLADEKSIEFSNRIIRTIETACSQLGVQATRLHSGAGHDAQHLATATEAGMIFVPSIGGISHDPREATEPEDIELGTRVLLATLLQLAV